MSESETKKATRWINQREEYCPYEGDYVTVCGTGQAVVPASLSESFESEAKELRELKNRFEQGIFRALECARGDGDKSPTIGNIEQILFNAIRPLDTN